MGTELLKRQIMIYGISKFITYTIFAYIILLTIGSCNKSDSVGIQGKATIQVAIADATFESEETVGNRAATSVEPTIQRNTIELNKDFLMVAELQPQESASAPKDGSKAALDTADLAANIRYRLLVYTQAGAFVAERDYIRGQEASTPALELDGGTTYTFVAVSLNTISEMPATTPAVATRTLANSRIQVNTGTTALMYQRQTLTVSGNSINRLDIIFKHQKAHIAAIINSTQTGYNISAADAVVSPHNNGMIVDLSNGSFTQSGINALLIFNFGTNLASQTVTTSSYINAVNNNITSFTIRSITIGSITATNLVPFTNLNVTAGVRYNLILNIVPNDQFLTYQGRPAARINGVIWARHNVGVATTVNADAAPMTVDRHGDYFQWGRLARSGTATSNNPNPYFASNAPANNTWNSGTEAAPVKTANDPCPTGYRIPTRAEQEALIADTDWSNMGPFVNGATRFDSAKVLTSTRNSQVRLTLPAQGWLSVSGSAPYNNVGITNRGLRGDYHSSFSTDNPRTSLLRFTSSEILEANGGDNPAWKVLSAPIRCVGVQ